MSSRWGRGLGVRQDDDPGEEDRGADIFTLALVELEWTRETKEHSSQQTEEGDDDEENAAEGGDGHRFTLDIVTASQVRWDKPGVEVAGLIVIKDPSDIPVANVVIFCPDVATIEEPIPDSP